ncbi:PAS domain S-box protein [Massilia sp.]|uniref:PAS domain S-box protein n=1 Tax=Massilia sp. TaxID=1882437 RepID=UPI0028A5B1DD|nr:PAS domain S-box protein [Massilia sp.]
MSLQLRFNLRRSDHIALAPSLGIAMAAAVLLLTLVTLQLVGHTASEQAELDAGRSLAELAFQTTDKLDRGMYERYREVMLMAERHEITDSAVPAAAKRAVLDSMQATYPYYAWIGLTDREGRVKVATRGLLEDAKVSGRPWFAAAHKGEHLHDVHEAVLLAKLLPNPGGEPWRFVDIAFPFRDKDGAIAGVLGAHLSWQWAADVERSVLRPLADRKAVDTLITDRAGAVLLGPKAFLGKVLDQESVRLARQGGTGSMIETWPDGRRYLVGYSPSRAYGPYPGLGWVVVVRQPLEEAYRPISVLEDKLLWGGLAASLLGGLAVWALARSITRPLQTITAYADQLREGALRDIPPVGSRLAEVQILQKALNALLAKLRGNEQGLRELNATLESRVQERTLALEAAVATSRAGKRRTRAIIDTALDAFVGVDAAGKVIDWNPRAEEIFGWTRDEALGRSVSSLIIPQRYRDAYDRGIERFSIAGSGGVVGRRLQLAAQRRNGEEFPVEMTIGLVNEGATHFFGTFMQDISERKRIEDELARERELLNAVLESIDVGVIICSREGNVTLCNRAAREINGLPPGAVELGERDRHYQLLAADGETPIPGPQTPLNRALAGELVENAEVVVKRLHGGAPRTVFASGRALHALDGTNIGAVIALKDVTELRESARRLEASERTLRTITDNLPVLIAYIDAEERYRFVNATYEKWYGVPVADIVGKTVREAFGEELYARDADFLRRGLHGEAVRFETRMSGPDGPRTVEVTAIPDVQDGACRGVYVLSADVSAAKRHEEELNRLARIDLLTGLPNRRSYGERLKEALRRARRSGLSIALMYLDVDHFKQVNDTLGHAAGDAVLHEFAQRVKGAVRATDTVCRLAGDEFTVILEGVKSAGEAALVAAKILHAFERPMVLEQGERMVSASIGVAYSGSAEVEAECLGAAADAALYNAKKEGRGRYALGQVD